MALHSPAACPAAIAGLRFLVVDDFTTVRRIVRGLLGQMGCHKVEEAADGVAALKLLRGGGFDFVVSDIHMPHMDGFELLRAIKAEQGLRQIPVLMVTAEARKEDIALAAQCGAAGYIVKPFSRTALDAKLRQLLHKRTQPAAAAVPAPAAC